MQSLWPVDVWAYVDCEPIAGRFRLGETLRRSMVLPGIVYGVALDDDVTERGIVGFPCKRTSLHEETAIAVPSMQWNA